MNYKQEGAAQGLKSSLFFSETWSISLRPCTHDAFPQPSLLCGQRVTGRWVTHERASVSNIKDRKDLSTCLMWLLKVLVSKLDGSGLKSWNHPSSCDHGQVTSHQVSSFLKRGEYQSHTSDKMTGILNEMIHKNCYTQYLQHNKD